MIWLLVSLISLMVAVFGVVSVGHLDSSWWPPAGHQEASIGHLLPASGAGWHRAGDFGAKIGPARSGLRQF